MGHSYVETDFGSGEVLARAEEEINERLYKIQWWIKDRRIVATGLRDLNVGIFGTLFALCIIWLFLLSYGYPVTLFLLIGTIIAAIIAYFTSQRNTIRIEISTLPDGRCAVSLTSVGKSAVDLEQDLQRVIAGKDARTEASGPEIDPGHPRTADH